jgi:tRNA-specific 2-thiouridylase
MRIISENDMPFKPTGKDIIVLISGGVDSAVTSLLLKRAGYSVVGITMLLPCGGAESDVAAAVKADKVASLLGIKHYVIDVREEFERIIIDSMRRGYLAGETPSPCVDCNKNFKFGAVRDFACDMFGIEDIATGHYARIIDGRLYCGVDADRDQTYFLYSIPCELLRHIRFLCGNYTKDEIRTIAGEIDLEVASESDSMELCFAEDYRDLIPRGEPGDILNTSGEVIGTHKGVSFYTIGQRRGIGIAAKKPYYVLSINAAANTITVGSHEEAYTRKVMAKNLNILETVACGERLFGKIRSGGSASSCEIMDLSADTVTVLFEEPLFAPAAGQHLVLYRQNYVVCGGCII